MEIISPAWALSLIVALIGILGAFEIVRYEARKNASRTFRAAILNELGLIYPIVPTWPEDIDAFLKSRFPALQTAVENFKPTLSKSRQADFEYAWLCYYNAYPDQYNHQCYHHYIEFYTPGEPPPDVRAIFHDNISRLLSYAKES